MKLLALDYGTKNIGVAMTDTSLDVVFPFGVVKQDVGDSIQALQEICKNERIEKVVMGLPLGLDGEESENTKRVRAFAEGLQKRIALPIEFLDERFTTHQAIRMEGDASRDEKSAMILLETYLQTQK